MKEVLAADFTGNLKEDVKNRRFGSLNSKQAPQVYFVLNDRFICEFDIDPNLLRPEAEGTYFYASETWVEQTCKSRTTFMIDFRVFDKLTKKYQPASWYISYDEDIDMYSSSLFFAKSEHKSMFTIVKYEAKEVEHVKLYDFLELIKEKPKYVNDQESENDWSMVQFRDRRKDPWMSASIEFPPYSSDDPRIYFEVIDFSDYTEGDFIPIDSKMRKGVIYMPLNTATKDAIAERINLTIKKMRDGTLAKEDGLKEEPGLDTSKNPSNIGDGYDCPIAAKHAQHVEQE